jgi:hypothetical protein
MPNIGVFNCSFVIQLCSTWRLEPSSGGFEGS